jgi:hypothetical protein
VTVDLVEAVTDLVEGDPLTVFVSFEVAEDEPDTLTEATLADDDSAGDPEYEGELETERLATEAVAVAESTNDTVNFPETLFDTIPVIVCVMVKISVRVPVAVTEDDELTVVV